MVSGGIIALVVAAATIGNTPETDGFFAAYGVYAMLVAFAQSTRTTVVARMTEGVGRFDVFDRYLGAGGSWSSSSRACCSVRSEWPDRRRADR